MQEAASLKGVKDRMLQKLFWKMTEYYRGDPKRIQHFVKVHAFARQIGLAEGLEEETLQILEAAAYVHDIGIKPAEEKYGKSNGKLQEQEGPAAAREMLAQLGYEEPFIQRVCYLVGHHHTYTQVEGMDYQILIEADFLVNLYEDALGKEAAASVYEKIFRTDSGKRLCALLFGLDSK